MGTLYATEIVDQLTHDYFSFIISSFKFNF